ncbi:MAG: NAD-dependent epimerase/dehydratase family protein [Candidatus Pacebacteria bacterium]|jgi:UDP-glucose 4-epimerase|nr:NAD-dependent epimerase/dehydratase family protein [Candidatus Paceibacterota bacterium]MBT6756045.1 NAD-dependent epimerase/dehydratase family protein [Candidatus Paceibacterota bacterium]
MKILITGGAGFIASHVADAYVANGHEVVIVDNLSTGKTKFVPEKAKFIEADITDKETIQRIIREEKPEVINHHAAHIQVGYSVENPQFDAENNIIGILNIMEAAKDIGVKKVIMAATGGAMYGNKQTPFDETMKEQPLSPYGISKRAGELYLNYYHELYNIPFVSLRYSNVYGPRQNAHGESGVVAIFSEMIMAGKTPLINGDGTHTRDYVYVGDVVKANLLALETEFVGELNIGTTTEISTNEVFDIVVTELGSDIKKEYGPARPGEQVTSSLSYQKAKEVLGWEPEMSFPEGVKKVAAWYKEQ